MTENEMLHVSFICISCPLKRKTLLLSIFKNLFSCDFFIYPKYLNIPSSLSAYFTKETRVVVHSMTAEKSLFIHVITGPVFKSKQKDMFA